MKARLWLVALAPVALSSLGGCPEKGELTYAEAQQAVREAAFASEAASIAEGSVEIATSFTLGAAAEAAAGEIRGFIVSQLPCAEVTLEGSTLTVEYGAKPGACEWRGRTMSGTHTITVVKSEGSVEVHHEWIDVSNGRIEVDGTADVTWDLDDRSRHIVHELTWTRLRDGATATGSGDRTQSPLGGEWQNGISVDGSRFWEGPRGTWDLAIDEVEWRWEDPVPQSGAYRLTTPKDKTVTMSFERVDEDTIQVTVAGPKREFTFKVSKIGDVKGDGDEA